MGSKRRIIIITVISIVALLLVALIVSSLITSIGMINDELYGQHSQDGRDGEIDHDHYSKIIIDKLNSQQQVTVKEVFDFDFDRAYVIKDSYLGGETIMELYDLDISIEEYEGNNADYNRSIVFVDKSGEFVYAYNYPMYKLYPIEEGMVIYPDTIIEKCDISEEGVFRYRFISSEYY